VVRTEETVLEQSVAHRVVIGEPGHLVDDPVLRQPLYVVDRKRQPLHDQIRAVIHPVSPIGVDPVARPDRDVVGQERGADDLEVGVGETHHRPVDDAGARDQMMGVLGTTEVVGGPARVGPDPLALHQRAFAVVLFMADVHDGVIVELHREVVPHAPQDELTLPDPVRFGLSHRSDAPRAVPGPPAPVGRDAELGAIDCERARPPAGLSQALRVEDHLALAAEELARLGQGGDVAFPGHVHGHGVLGGLDHHPQPPEWFEHLNPDWAYGEDRPIRQRCRGPHDVLGLAVAHIDEGVDHTQVRVLAKAEDGEPLIRARMHVEVVAVVEVPIAGGGVRDELGRLMNGKIVPRRERHNVLP
jgi:hypothetical protein